jgi:hypothetical protein
MMRKLVALLDPDPPAAAGGGAPPSTPVAGPGGSGDAPLPPAEGATKADEVADALRQAEASNALAAMLFSDPRPKKDEKPPDKPAGKPEDKAAQKPEEKPADKPQEKASAKKSRKVAPPPAPAPSVTAEDAARIAAQAAAEVLKQTPKAEPTPVEMPDHLKKDAPVYAVLEENPAYQGITQKVANFNRAELARAEAWEKEHGRPYNADDPEHAEWYARNEPKIAPEDWDEAKFEVKFRKRTSTPKVDPEVEEAKKVMRQMKAAPAAQAAVAQFSTALFKTLHPKHAGEINRDVVKAWTEANPFESEVAAELEPQVLPVVQVASMIWDGAVDFDEKSPAHVMAREAVVSMEEGLQAKSEELGGIVNDKGQRWVSLMEYAKLPPAQKAKYFTITKEALTSYLGLEAARRIKTVAQERREIAEKYASRLGYVKPAAGSSTPAGPGQTQPPPAQRAASPSVGAGGPTPPAAGIAPHAEAESGDFLSRMLITS